MKNKIRRMHGFTWRVGLTPLYIVLSSVLLVIFMLICSLTQYFYTQGQVTSYVTETDEAGLAQMGSRLDTQIYEVFQHLKALQESTDLKELLEQESRTSSGYEESKLIRDIMSHLIRSEDSLSEIQSTSITLSSSMYSTQYDTSRSFFTQYQDFYAEPVQRQLKNSAEKILFLPPGSLIKSDKGTCFIAEISLSSDEKVYLLFRMKDQWLDNLLKVEQASSFLYQYRESSPYSYSSVSADRLNETVVSRIPRETEISGSFLETLGKTRHNVTYRGLSTVPYTLVSVQDATGLFNPLEKMRFYMIIAVLLSVAFSVVFFTGFTRRKVADLMVLRQAAREYIEKGKGNLLPLKYKAQNLHEDTTFSFFLIAALPLLIFQITFGSLSTRIISGSRQTLVAISLNRQVESFEALVTGNNRISSNIIFDQTVQECLKKVNAGQSFDRTALEDAISVNAAQMNIQTICLYDKNGKVFYSSRLGSYSSGETVSEKALASYGEVVFVERSNLLTESALRFTRKIKNVYDVTDYGMKTIGYISCDYSDVALTEVAGKTALNQSGFCIYDDAGSLVYSREEEQALPLPSLLQNAANSPYQIKGNDGKSYLIFTSRFSQLDWTAISVVPVWELQRNSILLLSFSLNLFCLLCLLLFFCARFLASYIVRPIRDLIENLMNLDHEQDVKQNFYPNEFNELTYAFNKMTMQVKRVYDLESERNLAELKALQAQINPHFMYNTFESIRWMNKAGDMESVDQMIGYLSILFRLGISAEKSLLTLYEEVEYSNAYLSIQKMRYGDQLCYCWEIDPETKQLLVPKLILQPLIENSIHHGIRELERTQGILEIKSSLLQDQLVLSVSDNGPGFTEQERERQEYLFLHPESNEAGSVGLNNVYRRLFYCYGDNFSMEIQSMPYQRTTILLRLPIEPGENPDDRPS